MNKYGMNIFDGKDGHFIGRMDGDYLSVCERLIRIELDLGNAVELFYEESEQVHGCLPVEHKGKYIQSDAEGWCSLIK
jgi:hypothetical protein